MILVVHAGADKRRCVASLVEIVGPSGGARRKLLKPTVRTVAPLPLARARCMRLTPVSLSCAAWSWYRSSSCVVAAAMSFQSGFDGHALA